MWSGFLSDTGVSLRNFGKYDARFARSVAGGFWTGCLFNIVVSCAIFEMHDAIVLKLTCFIISYQCFCKL